MAAPKQKSSAINIVFVLFLVSAIILAGFNGKMKEISDASFEAAKSSVTLAISLVGVMALWLGMVRVLEAGGLMYVLAAKVKPIMLKLFPDVPADHPAMSSMLLNISANMLGLGNAATPLGIKAMVELNRLNPFPGTATNAMCLFLAINTSSVTILPLGVIGVRAAANASEPASIFLPTLLATLCSTIVGVGVALLLAKRDRAYLEKAANAKPGKVSTEDSSEDFGYEEPDYTHLVSETNYTFKALAILSFVAFVFAAIYRFYTSVDKIDFLVNELLTFWLMPALMLAIICFGLSKGVRIYEAVTDGAKQGFDIALKIIPFLVAILVAIGMFRASGALDILGSLLTPVTGLIGLPADVLPMALIRPLSGGGAFGIMSALVEHSPDSYSSYLASTMQGSTETTFYVLAVYFGAVGITKIRHALVAAILADITGIIVSCLLCSYFWQVL